MIKPKQLNALAIPALLVIVNVALKVIFLDNRDVSLDEAFTIFNSQKDFGSMFRIFIDENNPPFHFILVHFVLFFTKLSVFGLRFVSLLFSAATAVVIYKTGEKFFNKHSAIVASLIFSLSTFHVYYSHEVRVYTLFCLLTALIIYHFLSVVKNPAQLKNYVYLGIYNSLLIYSHYLGFILLLIQISAIFMFHSSFKNKKPLIVAYILSLLSFLPILVVFIKRLESFVSKGTWVGEPAFSELYGNLNRFLNDRISMAGLIIVCATGLAILYFRKQLKQRYQELIHDRTFIILFYFFAASYFGMFVVSKIGFPMFIDRYILYTSIPFFILIPIFIMSVSVNKTMFYIFCAVLLAIMVFKLELNPDNNRRVRELAEGVKKLQKNGTPVIICPNYFDINLLFYYDREIFKDYENIDSTLAKNSIYPVNEFKKIKKQTLESSQVIYVDAAADFSCPGNNILEELTKRYAKSTKTEFRQELRIYYFENKIQQE